MGLIRRPSAAVPANCRAATPSLASSREKTRATALTPAAGNASSTTVTARQLSIVISRSWGSSAAELVASGGSAHDSRSVGAPPQLVDGAAAVNHEQPRQHTTAALSDSFRLLSRLAYSRGGPGRTRDSLFRHRSVLASSATASSSGARSSCTRWRRSEPDGTSVSRSWMRSQGYCGGPPGSGHCSRSVRGRSTSTNACGAGGG